LTFDRSTFFAAAGCGEKSVLHSIDTVTEAYMRPIFHAKADRLREKADRLERDGVARLEQLAKRKPADHKRFHRAVAHLLMGLGGDTAEDIDRRLKKHGPISDAGIIDAIVTVMRQDAFNHKDLQSVEGRLANGMSVMAMGANTGCNTVYGSTPPNNPHPYPWMNSLFQDGATITWIMGESFIMDHARRSVAPERLADALLDESRSGITEQEYYDLTHLKDTMMTDREVLELPKAWAVGGDGGMGDIGFQNVSKVVLQNRQVGQVRVPRLLAVFEDELGHLETRPIPRRRPRGRHHGRGCRDLLHDGRRLPADAHRLFALLDFQLRDAGLFEQFDQLFYLANIH